jgi:hypothetical protein
MRIEVPTGDVADRIAILQRKQRALVPGSAARAHVDAELAGLRAVWEAESPVPLHALQEWDALVAVNAELWDVEDALRDCERRHAFGPAFVELARSVYRLNDRRASLKRAINEATGSTLVEEKTYTPY